MFTGIIEQMGVVKNMIQNKSNFDFTIESSLATQLKIDQSLSHNGVCLTVVEINNNTYTVTAIKETLDKSNLNHLKINDVVNLERAMKIGDRLDGHLVQGHVDQTATCTSIEDQNGSYLFQFEFNNHAKHPIIEKGSIAVNGLSLTVVNCNDQGFSVAIIPYSFTHTNFQYFEKGTVVNIEFDMMGKYVEKLLKK